MEKKVSNVSELNKIQQHKSTLENEEKTDKLNKCRIIFSKSKSFPTVCRNNSLKSIAEKELNIIYSQDGILLFMIKKFI